MPWFSCWCVKHGAWTQVWTLTRVFYMYSLRPQLFTVASLIKQQLSYLIILFEGWYETCSAVQYVRLSGSVGHNCTVSQISCVVTHSVDSGKNMHEGGLTIVETVPQSAEWTHPPSVVEIRVTAWCSFSPLWGLCQINKETSRVGSVVLQYHTTSVVVNPLVRPLRQFSLSFF